MARRTKRITIKAEPEFDAQGREIAPAMPNRDEGKTFLLTEMDAEQAEDWGIRALLALTAAGAEIPDDFEGAGMAGIAAMGVQALQGLKYEDVKPLWQQMFECVQICPDPKRPDAIVRGLVPDDIEEISTRLMLRKEIVELHVNFSRLASLSKSELSETGPLAAGVITRTFPATSPL